eukprot:PITA_07475
MRKARTLLEQEEEQDKYTEEAEVEEDFFLHTTKEEIEAKPRCFEDAVKELVWCKEVDEEMATIKKNATWELVDPPTEKEVIGVKWLYKTKYAADGSIQRHKARLVAKGYAQQLGIDYNETYAPVARFDTIKTILAFTAQYKWLVYQFDVKSAFLNGDLKEYVYFH